MLLDGSCPTQPAVVSPVALGEDSPLVCDHHAYLQLGGDRFAVPATTWEPITPVDCDPAVTEQRLERAAELERPLQGTITQQATDAIYRELDQIWSDPCVSGGGAPPRSEIVAVSFAGGAPQVVSRPEAEGPSGLGRALRFPAP